MQAAIAERAQVWPFSDSVCSLLCAIDGEAGSRTGEAQMQPRNGLPAYAVWYLCVRCAACGMWVTQYAQATSALFGARLEQLSERSCTCACWV